MKSFLFILSILIGLSSCSSTYYYSTLNTNDEGIGRDNVGAFFFDTDTIQITYSFRGKDGPIQIGIHNKLDKPMYVDWSRSAIIINNVATSYHGKKTRLTGQNIYIGPSASNNISKTTTSGYEYNPDYVSFIPPMRKVEHCSLWLSGLNFDFIDKKDYTKNTIQTVSNQELKVKTLNFSEENSPLFFESYLTIFLEDGTTYTITQSFYISNLIRTKNITPSDLSNSLAQRKDLMFTLIEANNNGWEVFAIGGVIVGTTILDAIFNY